MDINNNNKHYFLASPTFGIMKTSQICEFNPIDYTKAAPVYWGVADELFKGWNNITLGAKISKDFFNEIVEVSKRLHCAPEDLAAVIFTESGFDPKAKDYDDGTHHGILQMNETALKDALKAECNKGKGLKNITFDEFKKLSRESQLKYAEAYINFRIHEKGLEGKWISGGLLKTLVQCPSKYDNPQYVERKQKLINKTKADMEATLH